MYDATYVRTNEGERMCPDPEINIRVALGIAVPRRCSVSFTPHRGVEKKDHVDAKRRRKLFRTIRPMAQIDT